MWAAPKKSAPTVTEMIKWIRPPPGLIKVNTDASVSKVGCGTGCIAGDFEGRMIFAAARCTYPDDRVRDCGSGGDCMGSGSLSRPWISEGVVGQRLPVFDYEAQEWYYSEGRLGIVAKEDLLTLVEVH